MSKKHIELGSLKSEILIFGGVYSNLQALQSLKLAAEKKGIKTSHIFCSGDIVGYCAQPSECLNFIQEWGIQCIKGNVEENILTGSLDCGCNFTEGGRCDLFSKQWFPYTVSKMTKENVDFIYSLPNTISFEYASKIVTLIHGGLPNISEFIFKSTSWAIKDKILKDTNSDIIISGHSGIPFVDRYDDKVWLNAGVIGMPANDASTKVWYLIINDSNNQIEFDFQELEYNYKIARKLMIEAKLPDSYANTLSTGIWDNCEILPTIETSLQGKPLTFSDQIL